MPNRAVTRDDRIAGAGASHPLQIPRQGWMDIVKRAFKESQADQVPLLAAGVAFYSFLSLFPAMIAAVTIYGLVADPATVTSQASKVTEALPSDAASLITDQMRSITATSSPSLGIGLVISLALALWSASGGVANMMTAINTAYDEEDSRNFVQKRGRALLFTLGAIVFLALAVGLVAVAPALLDALVPSGGIRVLLEIARWTGLLVLVALALGVLYRYAPDRDAPRVTWVSIGAAVSTLIWLVASLGFSLYVDNFGSYSETYGALAGVVVLLLWLWITAFIVLFGAEINSEAELQTARDTTVGEPQPMGRRGAVKADERPSD